MNTVHRHFGKYMKRSADEKQVSVLLKDFDDADQLLTRIIDASKAWRESWLAILTYQHRMLNEFELLYAPIVGAAEDYQGHVPVITDPETVARTQRLRQEYEELKKDLSQELSMVDTQMIRPAQDAKDSLHVMKKPIKKREDKKLDFERYQSRVDTGVRKTKRSERDTSVLNKAQSELALATEAYNAADDHLRNVLPPILTAVFSLLPHLLAAQITIQNTLLGHYYTMMNEYCSQEGFQTPSPPMDEIIRIWDDKIRPAQQKMESINILATGKAVRAPQKVENGTQPANGHRRPSNHSALARGHSHSPARPLPPSPSYDGKPKISSSPSALSLLSPTTTSDTVITSPSPSHSAYQSPQSFAPAGPNFDYFSRDRQHSSTPGTNVHNGHSTSPSASNLLASTLATKKRPPPPPPRMPSHQYVFVTALYDFGGQGEGDLSFKEGDRIKVIKKTGSTDDWWQGELRGVRGAFPANYCQ